MTGRAGKGTGERPHTWIVGTDPVRHQQYTAWHRARAQAHYRRELWSITFDQWVKLWAGNWHRRGRHKHCLMLMKRRWKEPWSTRNAHLVNRDQFHAVQTQIKAERKAIRLESLTTKI